MTGENLFGVKSKRMRAGHYLVEGWVVQDVKGTTGWRVSRIGHRSMWFKNRRESYEWVKNTGRRLVATELVGRKS